MKALGVSSQRWVHHQAKSLLVRNMSFQKDMVFSAAFRLWAYMSKAWRGDREAVFIEALRAGVRTLLQCSIS